MSILKQIADFLLKPGYSGEILVDYLIRANLDSDSYRLISNVTLPTWNNRTTQIDHVLISTKGIFVIETKQRSGWIFGSEKQKEWTSVYYKKKYSFQNPLFQNYRHIATLSDLLKIPKDKFISIIVFTGEYEFKTEMPPNVMDAHDLINYINSHKTNLLTNSDMHWIEEKLDKEQLGNSNHTDYIHNANLAGEHHLKQRKFYWNESDKRTPFCPSCRTPMKIKYKGKNKFWGCPNFPKCKQIIEIV